MTFRLSRSARLQGFLVARHPAPVRWVAGALATLATAVATRDRRLAGDVWQRVARQGDFRHGLRLMSWYLCQRWPRLRLTQTAFFGFHVGMDGQALQAQQRFLRQRAARPHRAMWLCDCATVSAALALERPEQLARYFDDADAMLQAMPGAPAIIPPRAYHAPFRIAEAEAAIRDLVEVMPPARWSWFVLSGTFLGLVREKGFLPHDSDIDIGIIAPEVDPQAFCDRLQVDGRFALHGTEAQTTWTRPGAPASGTRPVLVKLAHRNGTAIDLFIHWREGDVIWHGGAVFRWDNTAFDLVPRPFCGTQVLGPADADRYLTENYGRWREPVTDFHYATDTPNLTVADSPLAVATFLKRALALQGQNPRAAEGLMRILHRAGHIAPAGNGWRMVRGRLG